MGREAITFGWMPPHRGNVPPPIGPRHRSRNRTRAEWMSPDCSERLGLPGDVLRRRAGRANRLNARQSALLAELFTAGRLALGDLEGLFPSVNRRTLQRDLKKLLEKGLLHEIGSGPTDPNRNYVPAEL